MDLNIDYFLKLIGSRECLDPGSAPVCGGPCPSGTLCVPSAGGTDCGCEPAPCLVGDAPTCGDSCPGGGVCEPDLSTFGDTCRCILPTQPCGDTYPVCSGPCPDGFDCGPTTGGVFGTCGCVPAGTTPCAEGSFPVCAASCPAGDGCAAIDAQVGAFVSYVGCACGDPAPCDTGGLGCPPGQRCVIREVPGFSLRYCSSPSGAFL